MDSARHVIGCHLAQETMIENASDDAASPILYTLMDGARHVMDCLVTQKAWVTALMDSARRVTKRILNPGFLIQMAVYDVASTIHQSLGAGLRQDVHARRVTARWRRPARGQDVTHPVDAAST
jgi:hypothetical protein